MISQGYKSLKAPYFSVAGKNYGEVINNSDIKNHGKKPFIGILGN